MTTIFDLVVRILLTNIKKYRLFLICNISSIAILFSMISLVNNNSLMGSGNIDSIISSNIYAPTSLVVIFVAAFVPYTYSLLKKDTSRDYGILNSIGMLEEEVNICMLLETLILGAFSVIGGILFGNVLSLIVFLIVHYGIGMSELKYENSLTTYRMIVLFAGALYFVVYVIDIVKRRLLNATDMIISKRKSESGTGSCFLFFIGVVIVFISFVSMLFLYEENSNSALICFALCVLGIIVLSMNAQFIFKKGRKKSKRLFLFSDFLYYFKRNIKVVLVSFGMIFMILFFTMFTLVTFPNFSNNAEIYNPYHITYSEYPIMEWHPEESDLKDMTEKFDTDITFYEKIDYLYIGGTQLFSINDIRNYISNEVHLDKGECIYVKCEYLNDGYEHNKTNSNTEIEVGGKSFAVKEVVYDILFGKSLLTQGKIVLLSDRDFKELMEDKNISPSRLCLLNFSDYTKTIGLEKVIVETLAEENPGFKASDFMITSRAVSSRNARNSSLFLLFLVAYVSILFYFSVLIMIHYKFEMEIEEERHKMQLLQSMGASESDVGRMLFEKVCLIFLTPFLGAVILTVMYGYGTNFSYGYGFVGIRYAILVSIVWFSIIATTIILYYRRYMKLF